MPRLHNPEDVTVQWKFNPDFKDLFLDIWYDLHPDTFKQAFKDCDEYASEMIRWLRNLDKKLHDKIYGQTLKEMRWEENE